jgi:hypothetical protein
MIERREFPGIFQADRWQVTPIVEARDLNYWPLV